MKLTFKLDAERLTLNQLIAMQDGRLKAMRDVLASALLDDNGEALDFEEAQGIIGNLPLSQIQEAAEEFKRQVRDSAVNPQSGGD